MADNEADKFVNDFDYDFYIDNNGTLEELDRIAHHFTGLCVNFK